MVRMVRMRIVRRCHGDDDTSEDRDDEFEDGEDDGDDDNDGDDADDEDVSTKLTCKSQLTQPIGDRKVAETSAFGSSNVFERNVPSGHFRR